MRMLGSDIGATVLGQGIHEVSTVSKYRLGTRVVRGDCVYKYCKVVTNDITKTSMIVYSRVSQIFEGGITTASPAGSNTVNVTPGSSDGILGDGVFEKHCLESGRIFISDATWSVNQTYGILDNDWADETLLTITLDEELALATVATRVASILVSPYLVDGLRGSDGARAFIGVPMRTCVADSYLWVQTWGPCWVSPGTEVSEAAENRSVYIKGDGGLTAEAELPEAQYAGYILSSGTDGTQGTPWIYLMCSR